MSLPQFTHPTFSAQQPSTGKTIRFRPFLVKEEKILLMAAASGNLNDIMRSIKQIISNCVIDPIDVEAMPIFDLEYIFLQLRARSINNVVEVSYRDNEDDKVYTFHVDLDEVCVNFTPNHTNKIKLNDDMGIIMRYPKSEFNDYILNAKTDAQVRFELVLDCVDKLWVGEEFYDLNTETREEKINFLDGLAIKDYQALRSFLDTIPHLRHAIKYKNSLGNDREIVLESLGDFFTLG
jgi:hypothetical protein